MIIALDARPLVRRQIGGTEQRARNILSAWVKTAEREKRPAEATGKESGASAHEFYLLYPKPSNAEELRDAFDDSLLQNLPPNFHQVEISSYSLPSSYHLGMRVLNALTRNINKIKPDVYHSFTPDVPRIERCPVVPTVHDLSFELDPVVRRTPAGREMHGVMLQSAQYAKRLISVSSQTKYDIASIYRLAPDQIDVIYNGIDAAFAPTPATEILKRQPVHRANDIKPPYVLAVGADIPRRNYSRMLAAMEMVWKSAAASGDRYNAQTQWVLAGREDWNVSNIYAAGKAAGVLDRMRFVRSPSNVELADLYRGAALTCCASSFEGFGLSVLESMACGAAVACSDMRSLREVAEDAAVYFPHDDAESMGQAIAGLLEDAEYRRQLKYRGIFRAKLFTWETAAQLTLASLTAAAEQN